MLRNYFKTAWRNLLHNKIFSAIKILGLSLGLTVCMLIFLYTKDEISYDRFHANSTRLYRITMTTQIDDNPSHTGGFTNSALGESLAKDIPGIQQFVRMNNAGVTVKKNNDSLPEHSLLVDDNFFTVFSFQLAEGDKKTALTAPSSVVLSKNMAKKYFGSGEAIGKTLQIKRDKAFENYKVTAIAENLPQNSSIKADMFFPIKYSLQNNDNPWTGRGNVNTFLLLSPQANVQGVEERMNTLLDINKKDFVAQMLKEQGVQAKLRLALQPLTAIHFNQHAGPGNFMTDESDPVYSYILSCIAVFILMIACINFITLAVAQSLKRSKEIGVRKAAGSTRKQLIRQFLTESFLISFIAFVIAIALTIIMLPFFNELADKKLSLSYLSDRYLYAGYFLLLLITSFIAGFYPSLVLSSFQPAKVLYGRQKLISKNYFTKGLVVLQFALAAFLIIGTVGINAQLDFMEHKNLGYDNKNLVKIDLPFGDRGNQLAALFKNKLSGLHNIIAVAARNAGRITSGAKVNGKVFMINYNKIDDRFLPTFKIRILAGRNFSPGFPSDSARSVIINEAFAKESGWKPGEAVGKTFSFMDAANTPATVVGVIKDYHFASLKEKIGAEVFTMSPAVNYEQLWIRIKPGNIPETLELLQNTFTKSVPYFPYAYQFMDDINAKNYKAEAKWKQIISIASGLFIFISCIGLLGLVMLSIEQRTKEIGIRKVLGAAVSRIVMLITKEFIVLILIAFVIAAPAGYYFFNKWLQDFAYRMDINWWLFVLPGLLIITMALLTMSVQTIRAATAKPVKSLRTE